MFVDCKLDLMVYSQLDLSLPPKCFQSLSKPCTIVRGARTWPQELCDVARYIEIHKITCLDFNSATVMMTLSTAIYSTNGHRWLRKHVTCRFMWEINFKTGASASVIPYQRLMWELNPDLYSFRRTWSGGPDGIEAWSLEPIFLQRFDTVC